MSSNLNSDKTPQKQAKLKPGKGGIVPPVEHRWKPGVSPNPGGLPKGTPRLSTAYQKILNSPAKATFKPETRGDKIALAIIEEAEGGDVQAAKEIADRIEGKSPQTINQNSVNIHVFTAADLLDAAHALGLPPISEADAARLIELVTDQGVE